MTASDTDTHYRKQTIPEDGQWARVDTLPTPSGRVESLAQLHSQRLASRWRRCPKDGDLRPDYAVIGSATALH